MIIPGGGISSNNVQDAIEEVNNNKVSKSGDTMTGNLNIRPSNTLGVISVGKGSNSQEYGVVQMYDDASHWLNIMPSSQTDNRTIYLPDKTGTLATTDDNYYHPGDVFSTTWLQWPCFINNGATAADCYMTLPKAIGSDVTNATITIGNISNLRVNGNNYNSGMSLGGGGVNSTSGIISFFINGNFGNNSMCTGQVAINNFTVTFI